MSTSASEDDVVNEFAELAARVAKEVGDELVGRRPDDLSFRQKADAQGEVSDLDIWAEREIVSRIRNERPHDGFNGEEEVHKASSSGVVWHIDPIDGSVNFIRGIPGWTVVIAAVRDGEPLASAVHDPATNELFVACEDGVTINAKAMQPSARTQLSQDIILGTGFCADLAMRAAQGRVLAEWFPLVRDVRRSGSSVREAVYVATGRLDAFYGYLNDYEIATVQAFAKFSGATVTIDDVHARKRPGYMRIVMAATAQLHTELKKALLQAEAAGGLIVDDRLVV